MCGKLNEKDYFVENWSMARKKTPSELRVSYQTLDLNLAFNLCDYMEDASVIIVHY